MTTRDLGECNDHSATPDRRNRKVGQILVAARSLFLQQIYDDVTMDMVTRASGVSKATLYAHFASKEQLCLAVMIDENKLIADKILSDAVWNWSQDDCDVAAALRRIGQNFVEIFLSVPALLFRRAVLNALPRVPGLGRTIFEQGPGLSRDRLAAFLMEIDRAGFLKIPDPALASTQFLSVVRGDIDIRGLLSVEFPSPAQIDVFIEEGVAMFMARYARDRA